MKKLLISTALVASMGFASSAFAQEVVYEYTVVITPAVLGDDPSTTDVTETDFVITPAVLETRFGTLDQFNAAGATAVLVGTVGQEETNSLAGQQQSLLQTLLSQAEEIQVSLANTSENLANINGSINLNMTRFDDELPDVVAGGLTGATISEPIDATIGNLTTTVIGSLGSGTIDTDSTLSNITSMSQAITASSSALNAQFAPSNLGLTQVYNLSSNLGALDASINVDLAGVTLLAADNIPGVGDLQGQMATWATTAIGSLGTGEITSTVVNNATGLTERLVGTN